MLDYNICTAVLQTTHKERKIQDTLCLDFKCLHVAKTEKGKNNDFWKNLTGKRVISSDINVGRNPFPQRANIHMNRCIELHEKILFITHEVKKYSFIIILEPEYWPNSYKKVQLIQ